VLVIWLWGGFYVSSFTCRFFYAIHFLVPLLVLGIRGIHLLLLHFRGRSSPGGVSRFGGLIVKFTHLFLFKDLINLAFL
jgi:quinol-cytochrome oxidoreductase complex cytochrome b subunit